MSNVLNGFEHPRSDNDDNAPFIEGELTPQRISYSIAASTVVNICEITLTVQDGHGNAVEKPLLLHVWLSDDAAGEDYSGTTASGTVQALSGGGYDFGILTAKQVLLVQTKADGTYTLEITDSAKTQFYVCAGIPFSGFNSVSRQLVTDDYGAA